MPQSKRHIYGYVLSQLFILRHIKNGVRYRESLLFTVDLTFTRLKELCHKFIRTAICRASIASSPLVRYQAYSLEGDRWPQTCKSQLFVHIQAFVPHVRASRISTYCYTVRAPQSHLTRFQESKSCFQLID